MFFCFFGECYFCASCTKITRERLGVCVTAGVPGIGGCTWFTSTAERPGSRSQRRSVPGAKSGGLSKRSMTWRRVDGLAEFSLMTEVCTVFRSLQRHVFSLTFFRLGR